MTDWRDNENGRQTPKQKLWRGEKGFRWFLRWQLTDSPPVAALPIHPSVLGRKSTDECRVSGNVLYSMPITSN